MSVVLDWSITEDGRLVATRGQDVPTVSVKPELSLADTALLVAWKEAHNKVRETSPNWGTEIREYLHEAGFSTPAPWCGAYVNWCAKRAATFLSVHSPLEDVPLEALVQSYVDHGRKHGWVVPADKVKPGDLFCLYYSNLGRYGHIGFVESIDLKAGTIRTIEGNTNDGGSREGDGVYMRTRRITKNVLFLHWSD